MMIHSTAKVMVKVSTKEKRRWSCLLATQTHGKVKSEEQEMVIFFTIHAAVMRKFSVTMINQSTIDIDKVRQKA